MEAYLSEHLAGFMPSLTLWPIGDDRSRMRCQLLGFPGLGIMPNGLVWADCADRCVLKENNSSCTIAPVCGAAPSTWVPGGKDGVMWNLFQFVWQVCRAIFS